MQALKFLLKPILSYNQYVKMQDKQAIILLDDYKQKKGWQILLRF